MGTRANIIIKIPEYTKQLNYKKPDGEWATRFIAEQQITLYRHNDGYPTETGADLVWLMDALQRWPSSSFPTVEVIKRTLFALSTHRELNRRLTSSAQSIQWDYQRYEYTDSIHGDIEYFYTLTYVPNTDGNPATTLEIKDRDYDLGWNEDRPDVFLKHHRTITLTKQLPSEDAFKAYLTPCGHYDHAYSWIACGEEAYSQVVVEE